MPENLDDQVFRSWEDYWAIAVRRRRWILLPMFLAWAAVWGASWLLPSSYQSEALVLVEQQKVPDQYVAPNVTLSLQDRLQNITQQTLSRTRLQATIDHFHLYSQHGLMSGDPVEQMRNDISIELVRSEGHPADVTAFKMRYSAASPKLAQQVNNELTSLFVNENVEAQQQLSEDTTSFLKSQLVDARIKMEEQEAKVAAFKAKHLGELPSQMESNVQILNGIQSQLQNTHQALDAARQQKLYLESLLQQYKSVEDSLDGGTNGIADSMMTPNRALADLRLRLQDLQSRYTDVHPDVVALKEKIAKAEKLKSLTESETGAGPSSPGTESAANVAPELPHGASTSMMQLESQLKANQLEIQNYQQHEIDLEQQVSAYRARLNMTPETEQELTGISRGYEESKTNYNSLLQKQMQSQLATSLEQRQKGEQFRIVDPPSLPAKPSAPNTLKVSLGGLALGIALGLGLATVLELTDVRVRQEVDLEGIVPVRVLVGIPRLTTANEERARVMNRWLELGAVTLMVTLIAIGNLYAFYRR